MNWIWLDDCAYNMDEVIWISTDKDDRFKDLDINVIVLYHKDEGIRQIRYNNKKKFDKDLALIKSLCYKQGGE